MALTLGAVTRYFSGSGYDWLLLPPALVPWKVIPVLGPILRSGPHIKIDLPPSHLSGRLLNFLRLAVFAAVLVGGIVFLIAGNDAVALFRRLGLSMELEIPIWWMYLAYPAVFSD
ncbi:MAG: TRAP transporter small permease subunit [Albidovulum sp.]|nr:TRAP transporter small permease subunit [Albidovulum sp.]